MITIFCFECGKEIEFNRVYYFMRNHQGVNIRFCSKECMDKHKKGTVQV